MQAESRAGSPQSHGAWRQGALFRGLGHPPPLPSAGPSPRSPEAWTGEEGPLHRRPHPVGRGAGRVGDGPQAGRWAHWGGQVLDWPKPQLCPCTPQHVWLLCSEPLCHPACHPGQASPLTRAKGHPHFVQNGNSHGRELCGKATQECQQQWRGEGPRRTAFGGHRVWAVARPAGAGGDNRDCRAGCPG